jgi:hypothetical protein
MSARTKGTSARKWKGACLPRCFATATLVLLVGVAQAFGEAAGGEAHPRIFFHANDLRTGPDLRGRVAITGSHAEEYALLCQWAEAQLRRPASEFVADGALCQESTLTYALLYQLSGDARYGDRAVALIRALTTSKDGRLPGCDWPNLPATVATVFDWTYDRLSPEDRTRLLYDTLKRGIYIRDRKAPAEPQPFDPAPYLKPLAFASLTLTGEPEAARYAPDWQEFCGKVLAEQLATLDKVGADGAWLPCAGGLGRELDILEVLEAWRTATGALSPPGPSAPPRPDETGRATSHFRNLSRRILYRLRSGLILPGLAGDPPEAAGPTSVRGAPSPPIPPSLLYLLSGWNTYSSPTDDPTGRWLAETVRLANPPPAGSPAWLRDLRARILWLAKGTPRLSPEDAGLPLAASFADTGEVILRSDWHFTRPESTWLLFRVSPREPGPFAYWNHLALVRGSDVLAVETNLAASSDTGYGEGWFSTALAQNSVFDATGKLPAREAGARVGLAGTRGEFALEASTVGAGFAYMRGRVGSPIAEQPGRPRGAQAAARGSSGAVGAFEFTREVVAFSDGLAVVRDRVRGFSDPVCVLHMLDEPRVSGPTRTLAGTSDGGIRESTESKGVYWQTGQSRGYLAVLLPRERHLSTIGGKSYEFWTQGAGENLWPTVLQADGTPLPYSLEALRRAEVGTWRVEIAPGAGVREAGAGGPTSAVPPQSERAREGAGKQQRTQGAATQFLTVLAAGGRDSAEPQGSAEEKVGGVQVRVTWQGRLYAVTLEDEGTGSVEVTEVSSAKVLIRGTYPAGRSESQ